MLPLTLPLAPLGVGDVLRVLGGTQKIDKINSREMPAVPKGTNVNSRGLRTAMRSEAHRCKTVPSSNPESPKVPPTQSHPHPL